MKYSAIEIGKKIRQNREELGLTQGQLGEMLSKNIKEQKSVHAISEYESGKTLPPLQTLFNLCNVFNCDLGYLLGEEEYSDKTKLNTTLVEELGLPYDVIHKIKMISGIEPGIGPFKKYNTSEYKDMFCKLVLSESLTYVLETMNRMKNCNDIPDKEWEKLCKKHGEDLMKRAEEIEHGSIDYEHDPDAPKLSKKEIAAWDALLKYEKFCYERSYDNKIWRYDYSEACRQLFDELFPEAK